MSELLLKRVQRSEEYGTFSELYFPSNLNKVLCVGLEPYNHFPAGVYELKLVYSPKFSPSYGHNMIWICREPDIEYKNAKHHELLHIGNYAQPNKSDTDGCVLTGSVMWKEGIIRSKEAYNLIYPILSNSIQLGTTMIRIEDAY